MYTQCPSCNFWLSPGLVPEGCPNCGFSGQYTAAADLRKALKEAETELSKLQQQAERVSRRLVPISLPLLAALAVIAVAIAVGTVRVSHGVLEMDDLGVLAKLLGTVEFVTVGIWWARRERARRAIVPDLETKEREILELRRELKDLEQSRAGTRSGTRAWTRPCLQQDIQKIDARLLNIQKDRDRLELQRKILLKEDSEKWRAALDLITAADIELVEWSDRERIALREIGLAQWVNNLEAHSLGIEELSIVECDLRLLRLRRVATDGRALLERWGRDDVVHPLRAEPKTPLGMDAWSKSIRCRQQVEQGLVVCQELCDGVQARRVVATVNAVGHHAAAPINEYIPRARKALEELTARSELGHLRESFRHLEDLAALSSARREVDQLTAKIVRS